MGWSLAVDRPLLMLSSVSHPPDRSMPHVKHMATCCQAWVMALHSAVAEDDVIGQHSALDDI